MELLIKLHLDSSQWQRTILQTTFSRRWHLIIPKYFIIFSVLILKRWYNYTLRREQCLSLWHALTCKYWYSMLQWAILKSNVHSTWRIVLNWYIESENLFKCHCLIKVQLSFWMFKVAKDRCSICRDVVWGRDSTSPHPPLWWGCSWWFLKTYDSGKLADRTCWVTNNISD